MEAKIKLENFLRDVLQMHQPAAWTRRAKVMGYEVAAVSLPTSYEGFAFCLKTPDYRPYLSGSELKGALRTALLTKMLCEDTQRQDRLAQQLQSENLDELVQKVATTRGREQWRWRSESRRELKRLWQESEWQSVRKDARDSDAHHDLLRGIAISDSEPFTTDSLCIYKATRLGMSRDVTVFIEAIQPQTQNTKRETQVTLSIAHPDRWLQKIGLTDKAGWLNWDKLSEALYEHANSVLDFIAQKFPVLKERTEALRQQNEVHAPLLRLGWGQGFLSVTMTQPLQKQHEEAYEALRRALAQAFGHYKGTKPYDFPKSLWAVLDSKGNPCDLFGWVKLVKL